MVIILICILILSSFYCVFPCFSTPLNASTSKTYFARVMFDNVQLYKTPYPLEDYSNIYFVLPQTYFVQLVDEVDDYYKVNYINFSGYVKKDSVQTIVGIPKNPFLTNVRFRVYSEQSRDLRTLPTVSMGNSSQVAYIPLYSRNLTFYGKVVGETLIEERTNVWYYCKYSADSEYYGYVYSDFCDLMTGYTDNTENVTYTDNPSFAEVSPNNNSATLNKKATGIIITVLMVPALIFVFLILKGSKLISKDKAKVKEVSDY